MAAPNAIEETLQDRITKLEEHLPQILPLLEAVKSLKEELKVQRLSSNVPEEQAVKRDDSLKKTKDNASATVGDDKTLEENLLELKRKIEMAPRSKLNNTTKSDTQLNSKPEPHPVEQRNLESQILELKERYEAEQSQRHDLQQLKNKLEIELLREQAERRSLEEQVKTLKHELETKLNIEHSRNRLQEEVRSLKQTHEIQLNEEIIQRRRLENKVQVLTQSYDSERNKNSALETQIESLNQKLREQNEKQQIRVSTQLVSCPTFSPSPSPSFFSNFGTPNRNGGSSSSICGAPCRDGHPCQRRTGGGRCYQH
ncbi:hypothetical protein C0J52_17049 [Blattella germanica]|nr:hypothetical protein C0J52_17049 [Blattella germanica]